ncbi:MAG: ribonuclease HII [Vampirovibrio sp.]|nr:ribonuclease HII [Vampirovibrio sp.]
MDDRETLPPLKKPPLPGLLKHDAQLLTSLPTDTLLIGVDEVGRGSLIGAVVAAAALLPCPLTTTHKKALMWLNDSKQLTAVIRKELCETLQEIALTAVGQAEKEEVDRLNVHHASLLAAYRAYQGVVKQLPVDQQANAFLLLDGRSGIPDISAQRQQAIIKGDGKSAAIAAASVVAKHTRDSWVAQLAQEYPGYAWERNMGYPSPQHKAAIAELGLTPHHRVRYKSVQAAQLNFQLS